MKKIGFVLSLLKKAYKNDRNHKNQVFGFYEKIHQPLYIYI